MSFEVAEYKWRVRKSNTARLAVEYKTPDGLVVPTTGCVGTLFVYDGDLAVLEVVAGNDGPNGRFDLFLSVAQIMGLGFRQGEYEFNVEFTNGDVTTFLCGPLVVESGLGPFE